MLHRSHGQSRQRGTGGDDWDWDRAGAGELKQGTGGPMYWKPRRKRDLRRSKRTICSVKVKCVHSTTDVSGNFKEEVV